MWNQTVEQTLSYIVSEFGQRQPWLRRFRISLLSVIEGHVIDSVSERKHQTVVRGTVKFARMLGAYCAPFLDRHVIRT